MIGILGGMGTQAGLDFCNKIAVLNRGKSDQQYPKFILYNKSDTPRRPENLKKYNNVLKELVKGCLLLQKNKCKFIVMPCNTAHYWQEDIQKKIKIPLISMPKEVYLHAKQSCKKNSKIGILCTEATIKTKVYSKYFDKDFRTINPISSKNFAYLTANAEPLPQRQGRSYLTSAVKKAPKFLKEHSDKGFFLMIEGSQIDWGGHANDSDYIITELIEFDKAIGDILDFAKKDGETLVIVTADHETGGFAINPGSTMDKIEPGFTSDYHTGVMIPVFAYGPSAEQFRGIYENTAIYDKMRAAFGFDQSSN